MISFKTASVVVNAGALALGLPIVGLAQMTSASIRIACSTWRTRWPDTNQLRHTLYMVLSLMMLQGSNDLHSLDRCVTLLSHLTFNLDSCLEEALAKDLAVQHTETHGAAWGVMDQTMGRSGRVQGPPAHA